MEMVADSMSSLLERISNSPLTAVMKKYSHTNIQKWVHAVYEEYYRGKDLRETAGKLRRDSFSRTKRRWAGNAIRDYEGQKNTKKELCGEYTFIREYFENYGPERFREKFPPFLTPEDYIQSQIEQLKEWSEDETRLLVQYPYLSGKTKTQIIKAIQIDLSVFIGEWLIGENEHVKHTVIESPYSTVEHPFFSNRKGKLKLEETPLIEDEKVYLPSPSYKVGDTIDYSLIVEKDYVLGNNYKVNDLDPTDYKIFLEVMSQRKSAFATQKIITVQIGEIVKNLYASDGKRSYDLIEERLRKMKAYSMSKVLEDGRTVTYGIFDFVECTTQPNGVRVADVHVNEMIYRDYIQKQTVRIYKTKVKELTTDSAHHLIFILQKERLICYKANANTKANYIVSRDYLYFAAKIRFKQRRKAEHLKEIEAALDDLIKQSLVVQSYRRIGEEFRIEFIPLNEQEVRDIVQGSYEYNPLIDTNETELLT